MKWGMPPPESPQEKRERLMGKVDWSFADGLRLIYGAGTIGREGWMRTLAALRSAIADGKPWAEWKAIIPDWLLDEWWERVDDPDLWVYGPQIDQPPSWATIPGDVVPPQPPGYEDGDWPEYPENDIPVWLPMPLIEIYGEYISGGENLASHWSDRAHIYDLPGLVEVLEEHGAVCIHDDAIAEAASG